MLALSDTQRAVLRALCQEYHVTRLELFGSAVKNDFDSEHSDVDLLVEFAPGTDLGPWMARFFELRDRLAAVLECEVDLVMAKGIRNPYFVQAVNRDRNLLYAA